MPKLKNRPPSYRLHKVSGKAVVTLYGRDKYLGRHGTPESLTRYREIVAEWAVQNPTPRADECHAVAHSDDLRTSELFLAYLDFAQRYYVKNGQPTGEVANLRDAIRPVSELFPNTRVLGFGPLELKRVRERMINQGLSRKVINARINRLRRIFKWGVENQLVPPAVLRALQAVSPLRAGRTEARERDIVRPVPMAHVDAIIPLVSKQVAAMIRLQLLTGMRPGEAVRMRANDLGMEGKTWTYRPASHKTEHHGIERLIFLGPKAQEVLSDFLKVNTPTFLFRPIDAIREFRRPRRERARNPRPTKPPSVHLTRKRPGERYTTQSYCYSIHKACKKAGVPRWGPNRLRHNAAHT